MNELQSNNKSNTITNKEQLQRILSTFPLDNVGYAFGYGSGVFLYEDSMIDLILSVNNVTKWHEKNLTLHADHYATLPGMLGPHFISFVQGFGAGCYFNPMVNIKWSHDDVDLHVVDTAAVNNNGANQQHEQQRLVKYGVISHSRLKCDLKEWDSIYIAGRMHKPTLPLDIKHSFNNDEETSLSKDEITHLQEDYNLRYALATALLLLPYHHQTHSIIEDSENDITATTTTDIIKTKDIYTSIAGLSYIGDPRMAVGAEDPNKVHKLVSSNGQYERFQTLYDNQFAKFEKMGLLSRKKRKKRTSQHDLVSSSLSCQEVEDVIEMNLNDPLVFKELYSNLPRRIQSNTQQHFSALMDKSSTTNSIHHEDIIIPFTNQLIKTLGNIIQNPARIQSGKGIITAGIAKSAKYLAAKLSKGLLKK